jgi:mitosis inhibitor protein kinase SWE1
LKNLKHKNIVGYIEEFTQEQEIIIIMELCSWGDLAKQIKSRSELAEESKYFSEDDILKAIGQTCQALKFADDCGVIHCDIKPGNILVA